MTTIWKQVLELQKVQKIEVPEGSEFLLTQVQHGRIAIWFRCDPTSPKEKKTIAIYGTGHSAPPFGSAWKHIGSVLMEEGHFVWHVFVEV